MNMTSFEEGYNRVMKCAGLLDRLRRVPKSLKGLKRTRRDLGWEQMGLDHNWDLSERRLRDWKGDPGFALTEPDVERYRKALAQGTTENMPDDPRRAPLEALQELEFSQEQVDRLRSLRNEQLKDVGTAGAAVAAPLVGAGAMHAAQED